MENSVSQQVKSYDAIFIDFFSLDLFYIGFLASQY